MKKAKNLEEAKSLVKRYSRITIKEIKEAWDIDGKTTARKLTGFSSPINCPLCVPIFHECSDCIYYSHYKKIVSCKTNFTYKEIRNARNPKELLIAFKKRAAFLDAIIEMYESRLNPKKEKKGEIA